MAAHFSTGSPAAGKGRDKASSREQLEVTTVIPKLPAAKIQDTDSFHRLPAGKVIGTDRYLGEGSDGADAGTQGSAQDAASAAKTAKRMKSSTASAASAAKKGKAPATDAAPKAQELPQDAYGDGEKKPRRHRGLKAFLIVLAVLAVVYGAGYFFFTGHFVPRTMVGGIDASWLSVDQLAEQARETIGAYTVTVKGDELSFELNADELGLEVDVDRFAQDALGEQDPLSWPLALLEGRELSPDTGASVDEGKVLEAVNAAVADYNEGAEPPTSAGIDYDAEGKTFVIREEVLGKRVSPDAIAARVVEDAILLKPQTKIGEDELERPPFVAEDQAMVDACDKANAILAGHITLKREGNSVYEIDSKLICQWVEFLYDQDAASLEAEVAAAVEAHNAENEDEEDYWYDEEEVRQPDPWDLPDADPGVPFTTESGHTVAVRVSQKGILWWGNMTLNDIINGENEEQTWVADTWNTAFEVKRALLEGTGDNRDVEVLTTIIDERPPETEGHEARGRHIDVNLSTQYARFYDTDGKTVIWRSYIVSGEPDGRHNTPIGEFNIQTKEYDIIMIGADEDEDGEPDYRTPCTYYMSFTSTEGFHDAYWRTYYGGDIYTWFGSHGCINLSYERAEALWNVVQIGDPVYIHY